MTEASKQWEGQIVEGIFPLRQYLGGSDHSAVFLTEYSEGGQQKAAIKLFPADSGDGRFADLQLGICRATLPSQSAAIVSRRTVQDRWQ